MNALLDRPRLSVCVPTYNFGPFIGETLRSVLFQIQPGVEVVVLDSGSTDETAVVVTGLQKQHDSLRYERVEARQGIDRDMARIIGLARGAYCWLFSADDLMNDGALARVLAEIEQGHDVYLCMHSNETLTMQVIHASHPVLNLSESIAFQLSDAAEQMRYFELAATTEAFFSFMSGLVIRKSTWESVPLNEKFVGTCWAHVARLFELIPNGLSVKFLAAVLVRRRGDNDSFATRGVVRRYALAIQGYQQLYVQFWGDDSRQAFHIRRALRREFRLRMFLTAKALCETNPKLEDRRLLDQIVARAYRDWTLGCVLKRTAYRLFPVALYRPARQIYRLLRAATERVSS